MFITLYFFFCFIKRWYPVMSPNDDKLAELEVSLHLETVTGTNVHWLKSSHKYHLILQIKFMYFVPLTSFRVY